MRMFSVTMVMMIVVMTMFMRVMMVVAVRMSMPAAGGKHKTMVVNLVFLFHSNRLKRRL